jgi:hypothetical protein
MTQLRNLTRFHDIPAKQDDASEAEFAGERSNFDGNLLTAEAGNEQPANLTAKGTR